MKDDESKTLLNQLYGVQPIINSLPESGLIEILNEIYTHTLPLRTQIKNRDAHLFDTPVFQTLEVKTFKSIKKIVQTSKREDVDCMYDYIDSFIASCDRFRSETKEKLL